MNEHHEKILFNLTHVQLTGLGCLAFLAIREKSTLEHQWEEWGFDDIPHETIVELELDQAGLLELATEEGKLSLGGFDQSAPTKKRSPKLAVLVRSPFRKVIRSRLQSITVGLCIFFILGTRYQEINTSS